MKFFFIENENTILHNDDEKIHVHNFVFTFINMYLHILRHFLSMILRMTQRHAFMSHKLRTHYVCVWCQIVQQVTDYQSTRDYTDFTIRIILDGSVKMNR